MTRTISDKIFLIKNNWKAKLQELRTNEAKERQKHLWLTLFGVIVKFGQAIKPVALVILAVFVASTYIHLTTGTPIPPLDTGLALIVFGYPLAWLIELFGMFGGSCVVAVYGYAHPQSPLYDEGGNKSWDEQERERDEW
jgi:dipeptide/tripeptide permease